MTYDEMKREYKFTLKNYPAVSNLFESTNIICTTTKEIKNGSRWTAENTTTETIDGEYYVNCIESIPFFRSLDGKERVIKAYTKFGYVPVKIISISPNGLNKTVREFTFWKQIKKIPWRVFEN